MKNFIQNGDTLTLTHTTAVASGQVLKMGARVVVATTAAAAGEPFEGATNGVFELPKKAADVLAVGDQAMVKDGVIDKAGTAVVGIVVEAAANGATTCKVLIKSGKDVA